MPTTAKQLLDAANAAVPKISGKEAQEMVANGALLVDVRDSAEVAADRQGRGRGPHPARLARVQGRHDLADRRQELRARQAVILHCASGGRAALAGKLLKDMGYQKVYNLGGFKDWVEAGGKVEVAPRRAAAAPAGRHASSLGLF